MLDIVGRCFGRRRLRGILSPTSEGEIMAGSYRDSPLPTGRIGSPDPHGAAALLLVESLIHSLMAQAMLRPDDVLSIVQVAIDAQIALNDERGDDPTVDSAAVQLLSRIKATFEIDGTS